MVMAEKRTTSFRMLMTERERQQLEELADQYGLTASDVLRQYVRTEHAARFGEDAAPVKKKKR